MNTRITPAIVPLDRLTPADQSRAGGKAWNCARLKQAGFPVPDGLAVLSSATADDLAAIADHPWFDGLRADTLFAVRSSGIGEDSAGQSFAGIHQTVLNVRRADLAAALATCLASAHTPQAVEYRRAKGLAGAIDMGVLIQCMVQPVAAGVAFTINPVSGAADEIVMNASWGLGEALVSGQVDADEFVVRKPGGELLWSRIGAKGSGERATTASLSPSQIAELATILVAIERHYDAPQDVEWCHDGAAFWVVQSRPVTTGAARSGGTEWTRANLAEVLPDLTSPQVLSAYEDLLNRAERQFLGRLLAPDAVLGPVVQTFCGRPYFNISQMRRVCTLAGTSPAAMLKSMGHTAAIQPEDERPARLPLREWLTGLPDLFRILWQHTRAAGVVRVHEARTEQHLRRLQAVDPRSLPDDQIWAVIEEWREQGPDVMQPVMLLSGVMIQEAPVQKICAKVGFPFEQLVYPQLAIGERSVSAQLAFDLDALVEIARREPAVVRCLSSETLTMSDVRRALHGTAFLAALDRFLETYGHRGRYESDWSLPRYREDPTPLLRALRVHLDGDSARDPATTAARQAREAADAWTAFEQRLSPWRRWTALPRVRRAIRMIKRYYVWRERVRSNLVGVLGAMRTYHLVLADRFVERGWLDSRDDYFLILLDEIAQVIQGRRAPATLRSLVADRIVERERYRALNMPLLMHESELVQLIRTAGVSSRSGDERQLSGHPVSGGCVEAEVVVVRDSGDFGLMKAGAILVAPATDPSWTPLFTLASGVIVEVGGVLSHASTIAREYGLPALANVTHATRRLKTGERVRLDATNGIVYRLGDAP